MPHESKEPTSALEADIARIEAMREAGTVTQEEADRLIAVLREIATAERDIESIGDASAPPPPAAPAPEPGHAPPPPAAPRSEPAPRPDPDAAEATVDTSSHDADVTKWIEIAVIAGDIRITGDDVDEPRLRSDDGDVVMERAGAGWRVRDARETWFGRVGGSDVDLTVPRSMGVKLDVKAGDVRIRDVAAVSGRMLAGDLVIEGTEAIDVHKSAGDFRARVRLTQGRHRIRSSAGDVDVTLLDGSDVEVRASVTMGDVRGDSGFKRARTGLGGTLGGRVGAGIAALEVHLSAGDVRIRKEGDHG